MNASHGAPVDAGCADAVKITPSIRWTDATGWSANAESVVTEAPLAIEIAYQRGGREIINVLGVTMRTPGQDEELAIGFLRAEGVVAALDDVQSITPLTRNSRGEQIPTQRIHLAKAPIADVARITRGLVTSSACGLCGRTSLQGLPLGRADETLADEIFSAEMIAQLPQRLREQQVTFSSTGGSHGAALCDRVGRVLLVREDVGRHNAVDKLSGAAWLRTLGGVPAILVLSGRTSYELVQKAAAMGIPMIAAVGAPSSMAVDLAHAAGISLIGFARPGRFNAYTHATRLDTRTSAIAGVATEYSPTMSTA